MMILRFAANHHQRRRGAPMAKNHEDQGFQPIGDLVQRASNSLKNSGSTLNETSRNSAIIGAQSQGSGGGKSTGVQRGGTAVATWRDGKPLTASQVTANLLASLPQSVTSALSEVTVDRSTAQYGYDVEFVNYRFSGAPDDDIAEARALAASTMRPASRNVIAAELARLRVTTKARAESIDDLSIAVAAYAENLSEYPDDVIIDALRSWARDVKWWPAWAELQEVLDRKMRRRRALKKALYDPPQSQEKADQPTVPPTQEQREAASRMAQETIEKLRASAIS